MKLIKSSATYLQPSGYGLNDIYKSIEIAGRTCYKSKMSDDPESFVQKMINSDHLAMLEHGTVYLNIRLGIPIVDPGFVEKTSIIQVFKSDPYSRVNRYNELVQLDDGTQANIDSYAITTNYRVFVERIVRGDFEFGSVEKYVLSFLCEPTEHHDQRCTFKIICDRGVSHELVRHRVFSFAQESTRYCNYTKDQFGSELSFIIPVHLNIPEGEWYGDGSTNESNILLTSLARAEQDYIYLINCGWQPQQARAVLPSALKTEVIMTGYEKDWQYFIALRYNGTTGAPHPDMKRVASFIADHFEQK